MSPGREMPTTALRAMPLLTAGRRTRERSISGLDARCSKNRNAIAATAAPPNVRAGATPFSPSSRPSVASPKAPAPSQSMSELCRATRSWKKTIITAAAIAPIGTFT